MLNITNRTLEVATSFTHPQIKRWAVAFLEPDMAAGQHSGIPRTYGFEQSFRIYFGGYLVENLKFTLAEARKILDDVTGWLNEKGWRIEDWITFDQKKSIGEYVVTTDYPWVDVEIDIGAGSHGDFFYNIKIISMKKRMKSSDEWQETYKRESIGSTFIQSITPSRAVSIESLITRLANGLAQNSRK